MSRVERRIEIWVDRSSVMADGPLWPRGVILQCRYGLKPIAEPPTAQAVAEFTPTTFRALAAALEYEYDWKKLCDSISEWKTYKRPTFVSSAIFKSIGFLEMLPGEAKETWMVRNTFNYPVILSKAEATHKPVTIPDWEMFCQVFRRFYARS